MLGRVAPTNVPSKFMFRVLLECEAAAQKNKVLLVYPYILGWLETAVLTH